MDDELSFENTKKAVIPTADYSNKIKTGFDQFYARETDRSYYVFWLTDFTKALPIDVHFTAEGPIPCKKSLIFTKEPDTVVCEGCLLPDTFDKTGKKKNKPAACLALLGYFLDSVGNVNTFTNRSGEEISVNDNPIKFALLKRGRDDINLEKLKEFNDDGMILDDPWELRKYPKEAKKAMVPQVAIRKKVEKQFQHLGGIDVPPAVREMVENMTKQEVRGLAVNTFAADPYHCVNWEDSYLLKNVVKPEPDSTAVSSRGETMGTDLDRSLDG